MAGQPVKRQQLETVEQLPRSREVGTPEAIRAKGSVHRGNPSRFAGSIQLSGLFNGLALTGE